MARDESIALVRRCFEAHNGEWAGKRATLKKFKDLYGSRFWGDQPKINGQIRVETGDGPAHIESYLAALFSRVPACEFGPDLTRPNKDPRVAQGIANKWLGQRRRPFEQATRVGLIYPMAFLRVAPASVLTDPEPLDAVEVLTATPWEVILDTSAADWDHQRWIGHIYTLPLAIAKKRYPKVKDWNPGVEARFFERGDTKARKLAESDVPTDLQNVQIVEFYDLVRSKVIFWTPNREKQKNDALKVADMPLRRPGTRTPIHPIVPLYFAYEPDAPMEGIASLCRLYDQFYEKNLLRTQLANNIRKNARQWEAQPGYYSPEDEQKIAAGVDGTIVHPQPDAKPAPGQSVGLAPIPSGTNSVDFDKYNATVESDIEHGAPLAAFSRGEATRTTATEIGVLAQYTASAIGRMARERDAAIEAVAALYLAHLEILAPPPTVTVDAPAGPAVLANPAAVLTVVDVAGTLTPVTGEMLDARWEIQALDQAGTPMSQAIEQTRFIQLLPQLMAMQIPAPELIREMVRLQILSPKFHALADQATAVGPAGAAAPGAQPGGNEPLSEDQLFQLAGGRGLQPPAPQGPSPLASATPGQT